MVGQDGVCDREESVLNRDPWCCPDPGISGTSLEGVCEARGGVTQDETGICPPNVRAGSSRHPTMMEET